MERTVSTVLVRPPPIIEGSQHNFRIFTINKFPLYATPDSMRILTALAAPSPFSWLLLMTLARLGSFTSSAKNVFHSTVLRRLPPRFFSRLLESWRSPCVTLVNVSRRVENWFSRSVSQVVWCFVLLSPVFSKEVDVNIDVELFHSTESTSVTFSKFIRTRKRRIYV